MGIPPRHLLLKLFLIFLPMSFSQFLSYSYPTYTFVQRGHWTTLEFHFSNYDSDCPIVCQHDNLPINLFPHVRTYLNKTHASCQKAIRVKATSLTEGYYTCSMWVRLENATRSLHSVTSALFTEHSTTHSSAPSLLFLWKRTLKSFPLFNLSIGGPRCSPLVLWVPPPQLTSLMNDKINLHCHHCNYYPLFTNCLPPSSRKCSTTKLSVALSPTCHASIYPNSDPVSKRRFKRTADDDPQKPHRRYNITWTITDFQGIRLNSTTNFSRIEDFYPPLQFDLAEMLVGSTAYNSPSYPSQPSHTVVNEFRFYVCPGQPVSDAQSPAQRLLDCGGPSDYFCKAWSCVSTGHIYWDPGTKGDLITASRTTWDIPCSGKKLPKCNPVTIRFTDQGRKSTRWDTGLKWGARLKTVWPGEHYGNIFYIQRHIELPRSDPVGPQERTVKSPFLQPIAPGINPLIPLIKASYALLNSSNSSIASTCWLCVSASPPFYEAITSQEPIVNSTSDKLCRWRNSVITVSSITGVGCCLGNIPSNYSQYCHNVSNGYHCNLYLPKNRLGRPHTTRGYSAVYTTSEGNLTSRLKGMYFIPGNNSVWACSTGLTACVHGDELVKSKSFCIQVWLVPKIDVYNSDDFISLQVPMEYPPRAKREIISTLTLGLLLALGATGASTGIAGLAVSDQRITALGSAIDADLLRIEKSIVALQNSLTSLSEVVLQNRRGLDLLFLKQGGLCAALKEECCFYADSRGVVLDSMNELEKRLKDREKERLNMQNWYQGLFSISPWLTTLLTALALPLDDCKEYTSFHSLFF